MHYKSKRFTVRAITESGPLPPATLVVPPFNAYGESETYCGECMQQVSCQDPCCYHCGYGQNRPWTNVASGDRAVRQELLAEHWPRLKYAGRVTGAEEIFLDSPP